MAPCPLTSHGTTSIPTAAPPSANSPPWTPPPRFSFLRPADAESAIARGISGPILSTYGTSHSSIALLPALVAKVQGRIPVLVDGGVRRGTDILKALILGANAVVVTRPPLWGLAAYGAGRSSPN